MEDKGYFVQRQEQKEERLRQFLKSLDEVLEMTDEECEEYEDAARRGG